MKVVSYNINGIRAAIKKGFVSWLKEINADVICLQEIKACKEQFDEKLFSDIGYYCFWHFAKKRCRSSKASWAVAIRVLRGKSTSMCT